MKYAFIHMTRKERRTASIARQILYEEIFKELPKSCRCCGRKYPTEIEYNNRTERASNALYEAGFLNFMRNCHCESTLNITLNMNDWHEKRRRYVEDYITNLGMTAERNFRAQYKSGTAWKYINSTMELVAGSTKELEPHKHDIKALLEALKESKMLKYFWDNVGVNILRDIHNDDVRRKEKGFESKHKVLIINGKDPSLRDLFIPETKVAHRHGLREGMRGLRDNPEGISAIVLDMADRSQEDEYISWVRKHDASNHGNHEGFITHYRGGASIPIFRFAERLHSDGRTITLVKPCPDLVNLIQSSFKK